MLESLKRKLKLTTSARNTIDSREGPLQWLHGHTSPITCVDGNVDLGIVISGSATGTCLIHDMYTGQFVVSLNVHKATTHTTGNSSNRKIYLVRLIPNTSFVVVVTCDFLCTFSSSTGELMKQTPHSYLCLPHSIGVSPDSRFLLVGSPEMVTVVVVRDLEIKQICCRVLSPEKLKELRSVDALRTRTVDGAEVTPDGTVLVESTVTSATLSSNGDVAFAGCENGDVHAFLVGLNRG